MTPEELKAKEDELVLREQNLKAQQTITMLEHTTITQLIPRVTEAILNELKSKHICIQGERLVKMESNIETIMERQATIKDDLKEHGNDVKKSIEDQNAKIDKHLTELYKRNEDRKDEIGTLDKKLNKVTTIFGVVFIVFNGACMLVAFLWDKLTWK